MSKDELPEKDEAIETAEIMIKAHILGEYDKTHREEIRRRGKEILNSIRASNFNCSSFDLRTQGFIGHYILNIIKDPEPFDFTDGVWLIAIGYWLAKEEENGDKGTE